MRILVTTEYSQAVHYRVVADLIAIVIQATVRDFQPFSVWRLQSREGYSITLEYRVFDNSCWTREGLYKQLNERIRLALQSIVIPTSSLKISIKD